MKTTNNELKWKRWRHCWVLYDGKNKVGVIACKGNWKGGSIYSAHMKGKLVIPFTWEGRHEGCFTRLNTAKKAVIMEYKDLLYRIVETERILYEIRSTTPISN